MISPKSSGMFVLSFFKCLKIHQSTNSVKYFPKSNFPSDNFPSGNFPSGNFPNVQFPKRQLPIYYVRPSEVPQAAIGPRATEDITHLYLYSEHCIKRFTICIHNYTKMARKEKKSSNLKQFTF